MPRTSRNLTVRPLTLREVEVLRVTDLSSGMRRVTLVGEQLGAFASGNGFAQPEFASTGFDDDIALVFTYPGEAAPVLPVQREKGLEHPRSPRPLTREYTVRRWDPATRELDVDFVKHGIGVGTTWAYRARQGDRIHVYGPGASRALPEGVDWWLVAGDDTTIPAIARLLEELPEDARGHVFIEVARSEHELELREIPGVEVTWLVRDGAEAGTVPLLVEAVKSLPWREGRAFAWIAGERTAVRDLRRHLVEDRGVPKADIDFTGYWRRGDVVAMETDEAVPDPERSLTPFEQMHEMTELLRPVAIRAAVELGIPELISRGVTGIADLAARSGSDERALAKLLRYLQALDILAETAPGVYALRPLGEVLTVEFFADLLHSGGVLGREMLGVPGLLESVRTGEAAYPAATGRSFAEVRAEQDYEDRYLERQAELAPALADALTASAVLDGAEHLVIHSDSAGVQARALLSARPGLRITICARPAQADWLRRDLPETIPDATQRARVRVREQSMLDPAPASDVVLICETLGPLPDEEASLALRRNGERLTPTGRILLIEEVLDPADLDEHHTEEDLVALTVHGSGQRTRAELDAVIDRAGLALARTHTIGWGTTIYELVLADEPSTRDTARLGAS